MTNLVDAYKSKETLLERIKELEEKLENVYNAGGWGIAYVGAANYEYREKEASKRLQIAMFGYYED